MAHPTQPAAGIVTPAIEAMMLLDQDERLRGRPRFCSDCGLCNSQAYHQLMAQTCVFVANQVEALELQIHGRNRTVGDEQIFGVFETMQAARMRQPAPGAQWSGIITMIAIRLLERGMVDGVVVTGRVPGTQFAPLPFLARTPDEVRSAAGSKPCISPNLTVLDQVRATGMKRLAYVGTGCQVHALRAATAELGLEELYVIGIPCTDNTTYPGLQRFLQATSRSPNTVVHVEFMQDYRLWLRHRDGHTEKLNYVDITLDNTDGIFPAACMACFDYANTLADITVGYIGAPLDWQWVLVRNARGQQLFDLVGTDMEFTPLTDGGDRRPSMRSYAKMMGAPKRRPPAIMRKFIAYMQRSRGPKGLEFARSAIEMKLIRNIHYIRTNAPKQEKRLVPYHVYPVLEPYAEALPKQVV